MTNMYLLLEPLYPTLIMSVDISQLKQSSHQARAVIHGVGMCISPIGKNTDHHKRLYRL